jgi:hypothetical protein
VRRDRASPAKQGKRQKYIDVLSISRQSLQNKQCFHNLYAYLSAARNTHEMHAREVHAYEMHAREVHVCEVDAYETHA